MKTANLLIVFLLLVGTHAIAGQPVVLELTPSKNHEVELSALGKNSWQIKTTGTDPFVSTLPLVQPVKLEQTSILEFEYVCVAGLDSFAIYFGSIWNEQHSLHLPGLPPSQGWITHTINLASHPKAWLQDCKHFRFDFGTHSNRLIQIRNIHIREPNKQEQQASQKLEANLQKEAKLENSLKAYLETEYPCHLTTITATSNQIVITGTTPGGNDYYLMECPVWQYATEPNSWTHETAIPASPSRFTLSLPRFAHANGHLQDRLYSRWIITRKNNGTNAAAAHARYADSVTAEWNLPEEMPRHKKGLGGFGGHPLAVTDLDALDIASVTVNIWLSHFMRGKPSPNTMPFEFNGRVYYADKKAVEHMDATLQETARRNIYVMAIILVNKASQWPDGLGEYYQHPDCDPAGIYSMANVTSPEGIEYYAAALDFLARRYSHPDKAYGRIHGWIIHNEVDAGWVWTNCGNKPARLFLDQYHKSMRIAHYTARKYNPNARVYISLTHYWNWTAEKNSHPSRLLLEHLLAFSRTEGDFDWGIAYHPYPENLFEPKTWLDKKCDYNFNTPKITFKNLEVLDAWVKQPGTWFQGKKQRMVHLSEQGPNSPGYTARELDEQAACMAYAWKKIQRLDSIQGFQYHNWMDNRHEGGLRIGLRRFADDREAPAGPKPIWFLYQKLGTPGEDQACDFARSIIGITNWNEIHHPIRK